MTTDDDKPDIEMVRTMLLDAKALLEHYISGSPDNWDGSTRTQALVLAKQIADYAAKAQLREYAVQLRRVRYEYASTVIRAADAAEAVRKAKTVFEDDVRGLVFEIDEENNRLDWVHAEAQSGEPDHAEWENGT